MEGTFHEWKLVRQITEVKLNVQPLTAFFCLVCYFAVRWLLFERLRVACELYGLLLHPVVGIICDWLGFDIVHLLHIVNVDLVLASVTVAVVAEVDSAVLAHQKLFSNDYAHTSIILRRKGGQTVGHSAKGIKEKKGGQLVIRPVYRKKSTIYRVSIAFSREA